MARAADPAAPYSTALGGSASRLIDWYQVSADLPSFVGNATYRGEQLLMWFPYDPSGVLTEPVGMYHGRFNSLPSNPGVLTVPDVAMLAARRPAEILLLSTTGALFESAFQYLGPYRPVLVHTGGAARRASRSSRLADRPPGIRESGHLIGTTDGSCAARLT